MSVTCKPDGCYVVFRRVQENDPDASPEHIYDIDAARVKAFDEGKWHFIGIWARADILVIRDGESNCYTLASHGAWGLYSDTKEDDLERIFRAEREMLLADIRAMGNAVEKDCLSHTPV